MFTHFMSEEKEKTKKQKRAFFTHYTSIVPRRNISEVISPRRVKDIR